MFGMGGSEILVILIVALLFLGPDKLPEAAKKISKGIRDIKKQSRALQQTIEDDENIGGALRDLRSALRGEEAPPPRPKPPKQIEAAATSDPVAPAAALAAATDAPDAADAPAAVEAATTEASVAPARDPHDHDAEVASTFAFESGHMITPAPTPPAAHGDLAVEPPLAKNITLPPTAGEPGEATATSAQADADLATLVKPAPNTIARGATTTATTTAASGAGPAEEASSEPEHGQS